MKNKKLSAFSFVELSIVILIIGIMIAGVVSASRLVGEYRITSARNTSVSSSIASIGGLVMWLDVTAENKVKNTSDSEAVDNDRVKTWIDNSPQINPPVTFTEIAGGKGPVYRKEGINNLPTMYFQGTVAGASEAGTPPSPIAGCMSTPYNASLNSSTFTMFVVLNSLVDVTSNSGTVFSTASSNKGQAVTKIATKLKLGSGTDSAIIATEAAVSVNTPYIATLRRNSAESRLYLNGTSSDNDTTVYAINSSAATYVGCDATPTPGNYFNGYISEIILYERELKEEERKSVEKYLSKKYSITVAN